MSKDLTVETKSLLPELKVFDSVFVFLVLIEELLCCLLVFIAIIDTLIDFKNLSEVLVFENLNINFEIFVVLHIQRVGFWFTHQSHELAGNKLLRNSA